MLSNYETLILARSETTNDELTALENYCDKLIGDAKGKVTLFDKWGKYKLAYPVNSNAYGIYILVRYELPKEAARDLAKELAMLFRVKFNEVVMRHVTTKLPKKVSAIYKKPEPLDSRGASSLDSFIKEHKMEGLIESVPTEAPKQQEQQEAPEKAAPVEEKTETEE